MTTKTICKVATNKNWRSDQHPVNLFFFKEITPSELWNYLTIGFNVREHIVNGSKTHYVTVPSDSIPTDVIEIFNIELNEVFLSHINRLYKEIK